MNDDEVIVLFDGVCNLCNAAVQFIVKYNDKGNILFSPLQSDFAVRNYGTLVSSVDSIIVIENNKTYTKSEAALIIARHLNGWPKIILIGKIIPRRLKDWMYDFIAKNRYSIFGKSNKCMVPTPELNSRFML